MIARIVAGFFVALTFGAMALLSAHSTTIPLTGAGKAGACAVVIPAPTNVGVANGGAVATITVTVGVGGVPSGALIVVMAYDTASGTPGGSVADSKSNSYTTAITFGTTTSLSMFYAFNATALVNGDTITYTKQNSAQGALMSVLYATNVKTTDPKDTAVNATANGVSTTPSVTSGTPSVAGEIFIYDVAFINNGTFTQDAGHGWASPPNLSTDGVSISEQGGSQTNAGVGTKIAAPTLGTSGTWLEVISGFKPNC